MIQINRLSRPQSIWFTSLSPVHNVMCNFNFINLMTNDTYTITDAPVEDGDWFRLDIDQNIKSWPVGMYILQVEQIITRTLFARRLVYMSYDLGEPVQTDVIEHETTDTNVVYQG